jgi:hypothetical protein
LKDSESRNRGIGPVCWRRVTKVAKEERQRRKNNKHKKETEIPGQLNIFEQEGK